MMDQDQNVKTKKKTS